MERSRVESSGDDMGGVGRGRAGDGVGQEVGKKV